jgi:PPM family protein phosphatase
MAHAVDRYSTTSSGQSVPKVRYAFASDVGLVREENQDRYSVIEARHFRLFSVADGMGGARGGSLAASLAIEELSSSLSAIRTFTAESLTAAIQNANRVIHERASRDPRLHGMGTTLVALLFAHGQTFILNIGDSRAYLFRAGKIHRLTRDHNVTEDPEMAKKSAYGGLNTESMGHVLTRSLGPSPVVEPECYILKSLLEIGDTFILCSDGLYNHLNEKEMEAVLSARTEQDAVDDLIEIAKVRGGRDNITVIAVSVVDEAAEYLESSVREQSSDSEAGTVKSVSEITPRWKRQQEAKWKGSIPPPSRKRSRRRRLGPRGTLSRNQRILFLVIGFLGFIAGILVSYMDRFR